jgi:hypothetical protein
MMSVLVGVVISIVISVAIVCLWFVGVRNLPACRASRGRPMTFSIQWMLLLVAAVAVVTLALSREDILYRGVACMYTGCAIGAYLCSRHSFGVIWGSLTGSVVGATVAVVCLPWATGEHFYLEDILLSIPVGLAVGLILYGLCFLTFAKKPDADT